MRAADWAVQLVVLMAAWKAELRAAVMVGQRAVSKAGHLAAS